VYIARTDQGVPVHQGKENGETNLFLHGLEHSSLEKKI
jgi:hypothetical protein